MFDVRIGNVLDDVADVFKNDVPGGDWVTNAINSGANWIGDAAKTFPGQVILIGISNAMVFPAIANIPIPSVGEMNTLGPQVASVAFALPGTVKGDPFIDTYVREVTTRGLEILAYFGGEASGQAANQEVSEFTSGISKAINDAGLRDALEKFRAIYGQQAEDQVRQKLKEQGLDPESVAKRYWIRYDSAAEAIQPLLKRRIYDVHGEFPLNGDPPRYIPFSERYKLQSTQQYVGPVGPILPAGSYDTKPKNNAALIALQAINAKPDTGSFDTRVNSGSYGPIGQLLLFALFTAPAWAPVLIHHSWRR